MEMEMLALSRGACSGTEEVEKIKMAVMAKRILDTRPRSVRYSPPRAARCSSHLRTSLKVALTWYCLPLSPPAPHINYTLNDDEIMTDLSLMKKRELPPSGTSLYLWSSPTTCECRPRAALMDSFLQPQTAGGFARKPATGWRLCRTRARAPSWALNKRAAILCTRPPLHCPPPSSSSSSLTSPPPRAGRGRVRDVEGEVGARAGPSSGERGCGRCKRPRECSTETREIVSDTFLYISSNMAHNIHHNPTCPRQQTSAKKEKGTKKKQKRKEKNEVWGDGTTKTRKTSQQTPTCSASNKARKR